ncbi:RLA class II histocompatibility antigen, DP alpha-1 chain-like [Narcine bancroftii]|uniref:RLA class II histocompatibility antigen, DP alpha-1 chain-like n=1 Tax=Narcine bancroftii TaxID=1343680 RepID=UPI003830FF4F
MGAGSYLSVLAMALIGGAWAGKYRHADFLVYLVQDSSPNKQFDVLLDGDEILYMDFKLKKEVARIPEFQLLAMQGGEAGISAQIAVLQNNLNVCKNLSNWSPEPKESPQIAVYPEQPVEWGWPNTLICLADGFFPPRVSMKWMRNGELVTHGVNITEYYMKSDYHFQRFTYLSFVPSPGDLYSCHVEHEGLQTLDAVFWEPEVPEERSGPGTVICALGLTLGIISAVVGIVLLIKERQRLQAQQHGI